MSNGMVIPSKRSGKHFFVDAIPGFLPDDEDQVAFLAMSSTTSSQQRAIWHARLCHMNHVSVDKVLRAHNMTPKGPVEHSALFCETCAIIKRKQADITPQERPTVPFSFVGLDFWETRDISLQGSRYVFGAICYAT